MPRAGLRVLLVLGLVAAGRAASSSGTLPIYLTSGWEAADGDPPDGVRGLDRMLWRAADPLTEQAPRGTVRWYRARLALHEVDAPLGLFFGSVRDADQTFFDGLEVGTTGGFPPRLDIANLIKRLYPIPPSVSTVGLHVVAVRVFHGRRSGTVFRSAPLLAPLEALAAAQERVDEAIVLFLGLSTAAAIILLIFAWHAPAAREYPLFAVLSFLLGLYVLTMHSGWRHWPLPCETPFRLSVFASSLVVVGYIEAMPRLLRVPLPRRFLVYDVAFGLLALAAAVLPESESLVVPTRLQPWIVLLAFADLSLSMVTAFAARRRYAPSIVLGHLLFLAGGAAMGDVIHVGAGFVSNVDVGAVALIAGWSVLAVTFLRSMSDQLARFRVAGLTDPGTKLWNRAALFDEIAGRIDAARRGAGPAFGLVLADLDGFKSWNDTRGHLAGDRLLARAARALVDASRGHDLVSRYGGDEFAVIVDDVDGDSLPMVAARIHDALNSSLLTGTGESSVTASVGVASFHPARHLTAESLLADADHALYDAKGRGKNRVEMFRPGTAPPKRRADSGVFRRLKKPSGDAPKAGES